MWPSRRRETLYRIAIEPIWFESDTARCSRLLSRRRELVSPSLTLFLFQDTHLHRRTRASRSHSRGVRSQSHQASALATASALAGD